MRYNDWRQVDLPAPEAFTPTLPVSVILPYYQTPAETLARTLAALEGQTWPRDLFEVVIVDDGSDPPLERPGSTSLDVKVVRQERRGFGVARARNTGARAAAHDILLFLDSDTLAEAGWVAAHARWHHTVSDVLTVGFRAHVAMDGIDAETIRRRSGTLEELFSDRPGDPCEIEGSMLRTDDLTSRDDPFPVIIGGNFGVGRDFYWSVGGHDESFSRWGVEDVEFACRAIAYGGLQVPVRDAFAWHQGRWHEDREAKERVGLMQWRKAAHLIPHRWLRGSSPGRIFSVPSYVVTVDGRHRSTDQVIRTAAGILADRVHDLVVRIETAPSDDEERLARLLDEFGPDPRVRVGSGRVALDEFAVTPFHVRLPAAVFAPNLVHRLRSGLGDAVTAISRLPDGSEVSIIRGWALHRVRRAGGSAADYGEARTLSAAALKITSAGPAGATVRAAATEIYPAKWDRLLDRVRDVHGPRETWSFLKWAVGVVWWKAANGWQAARLHLRYRAKGPLARRSGWFR